VSTKRRRDPDADGDTPLPVILGEWWGDARSEIANATREHLEEELVDARLMREGQDHAFGMLWLRYMVAYHRQTEFYQSRELDIPLRVVHKWAWLKDHAGEVPAGWVDIFRDIRAGERELEGLKLGGATLVDKAGEEESDPQEWPFKGREGV
jgi:hypothetical protein